MSTPLATHEYTPGDLETAVQFLKRTWSELREIYRVRVGAKHLHIIDVNKDFFEIRGIGYGDPEVIPLLKVVNTAFDPETIHEPTAEEFKEYGAGRRFPWAHDRVM